MKFGIHSGQQEVKQALDDGVSTVAVASGRRWGKSTIGGLWIMEGAKRDDLAGIASPTAPSWIVAPTYDLTKGLWTKCLELDQTFGWITNKTGTRQRPGSIEIGDSLIEFKTADNPQALVSEGLRRLLVDEAGRVKPDAWHESLQPTRIDHDAQALLIGTPKGKNWFFREWTKGNDSETDAFSYQGSSYENPFIGADKIDKIREGMPQDKARQEIYAEFTEGAGAVFRDVDASVVRYSDEPTVAVGIDVARTTDFTVIIGLDRHGGVTHFDRWNQLDWSMQKRRLLSALKELGWPLAYVDATGVGDSFYQELKREAKGSVRPFKFTNTSKADIVESLSIAFDNREIALPDEPTLLSELKAFEFETTAAGNTRYGAPEGLHDDTVDALCLANHAKIKAVGRSGEPTSRSALMNF